LKSSSERLATKANSSPPAVALKLDRATPADPTRSSDASEYSQLETNEYRTGGNAKSTFECRERSRPQHINIGILVLKPNMLD
jgi:hypothetical protein